MLDKYIRKLPIELKNIIISYTYCCQDKYLLFDIKNYVKERDFIISIYYTQYGVNSLLFDLINYILYNDIVNSDISQYNNVPSYIITYIRNFYSHTNQQKIVRANNLILSFFKPIDRNRFINDYIVDIE